MTTAIRYLAYSRKSSQGESKQVESISDQETILRDLARREGVKVLGFLSEARSAQKPGERIVFATLMHRLKAGEANGILCWHLNRLARNPLEWGELQQLLQDGVIACIKTPEREYHPEDHALLMAVESSMASQYSRDLGRDVRRGTSEKAKRGIYPYRPKVGYTIEPLTREVIPDLVRFDLLRAAWTLMLTGCYSVPQVLARLNGMGFLSPRTVRGGAKPMNRSSLYRLFTDEFYSGFFSYDGEHIQGKHQPMVTEAEFSRVQRLLGRAVRAKDQKHFHPYAGLMTCGVCGCQITAETHVKRYPKTGHERSYTYYHCTGRRGCPKLSITQAEIESRLLQEFQRISLRTDFVDWAVGVLNAQADRLITDGDPKLEGIESREREVNVRLERIQTMREDGELTKEEFLARKEKLNASLSALRQAKAEELRRPEIERTELVEILKFRKEAYTKYTEADPNTRRLLARQLAEDYVLTQGTIAMVQKPAMNFILTFEPSKSRNFQIESGDSGDENPDWRALLDGLQKSLATSNNCSHAGGESVDERIAA